jgi:hypothetical protein
MSRAAVALLGLALLGAGPAAAAQPDPSPLWSQYPLDPGPGTSAPATTTPPPATVVPIEPPAPAPPPAPARTLEPPADPTPAPVTEAAGPALARGSAAIATDDGSPWPLAWTLLALSLAALVAQGAALAVRRRRHDRWPERAERLAEADRTPRASRDERPWRA